MTADDPDIQKLRESMARGLRQRSPLMVWFIEHHDEFAALLTKHGADWDGLTRHFAAAGMVARSGKPLTPRTVRNYWLRARRHVAKQRATRRQVPRQPTPAPSPTEAAASRVTPAKPEPAASSPGEKPRFEFVRLRNEGRGVSDGERPARGDPTAPSDPNDPGRRGGTSR